MIDESVETYCDRCGMEFDWSPVEVAVKRLHFEPRDLDKAFPLGAVDPPQRKLALALTRLVDPGGDVDAAVGGRVLDPLPDAAVVRVLPDLRRP